MDFTQIFITITFLFDLVYSQLSMMELYMVTISTTPDYENNEEFYTNKKYKTTPRPRYTPQIIEEDRYMTRTTPRSRNTPQNIGGDFYMTTTPDQMTTLREWYMTTTPMIGITTPRHPQDNGDAYWYLTTIMPRNTEYTAPRTHPNWQLNWNGFGMTTDPSNKNGNKPTPPQNMMPKKSLYDPVLVTELKKQGFVKCPEIFSSNFNKKPFDLGNVQANPDLVVISGCPPKHYVLTSQAYGANEVWRACAQYNTIPAIVESEEMLNCLTEELNKQTPHQADKDRFGLLFWTSYVDVFLNGTYISCTTGERISKEVRSKVRDSMGPGDACAKLILMKIYYDTGISEETCLNRKWPVICETGEVNDRIRSRQLMIEKETKCPQNVKKTKKQVKGFYRQAELDKLVDIVKCPSFLSQYSQKYEENKYSDFSNVGDSNRVMVINECSNANNSKIYLLSKYTVDFSDIWKECGGFGLVPATIETPEEISCINDNFIKKYDGNEQYLRFWTSQLDSTLTRNFTSCVTKQEVNDLCWSRSQPDNINKDEACVTFDLPLNQDGSQLPGLRDNPCDLTSSKLICESGKNAQKVLHKRIKDKNFECLKKNLGEKKFIAMRLTCNIKVMEETTFTKIIKNLETIKSIVKTKISNAQAENS